MSQHLPSISILIMSYNQEAFIGDCVDSVLAQEYDGELEFIFCDDNSSDSTFEIIQEKVYKYTGTRRIITHKNTTNLRVAGNMNEGMKYAHGEWIMRMDGDDVMHEDRVSITARIIAEYPAASAICGRYKYIHNTITREANPPYNKLKIYEHSYKDFSQQNKPRELEWWGGIMCMKREIFDFFGPMPLACDTLDDTMFATRSLMLGTFISVTNAVLIYYRRHENNISSENCNASSLLQILRHDTAARSYYRRGIVCHEPIIDEIERFTMIHPEFHEFLEHFKFRFSELKRQALFWDKPWADRIADAHIKGPFWKKIPWAIRVLCPLTYALAAKYMKKS